VILLEGLKVVAIAGQRDSIGVNTPHLAFCSLWRRLFVIVSISPVYNILQAIVSSHFLSKG
jgi:hypothetical protein